MRPTLGTVLYATVVASIGLVRLDLVRHVRRIGVLRPEADGPAGLRTFPIWRRRRHRRPKPG